MSRPEPTETPFVPTAENPLPNWGGLARTDFAIAAYNRRRADEISLVTPHHLVLFSFRPVVNRETRLGGTRIRTTSATSGSCEIVPARADYWARWRDPKESMTIALSEDWLNRVAQTDLGLPSANVAADALPVMDRRVGLFSNMLRDELRSANQAKMADLQLESLLNLVAIHVLKQYGGVRSPRDVGGLSDRQFRQLQEFLNAHLAGTVRLDDLATVVNLSSSQLLRSFRRRVGTSPHQYLTRLRLDQARRLIIGGSAPLAEVALLCGFSSQSHLTAVMRREDGLTPGSLRT